MSVGSSWTVPNRFEESEVGVPTMILRFEHFQISMVDVMIRPGSLSVKSLLLSVTIGMFVSEERDLVDERERGERTD